MKIREEFKFPDFNEENLVSSKQHTQFKASMKTDPVLDQKGQNSYPDLDQNDSELNHTTHIST